MKLLEYLVVVLLQVLCCLYDFNSQSFALDLLWCCFFVGSLILIGGDPGIGKSTLLLQVRRCDLWCLNNLSSLCKFVNFCGLGVCNAHNRLTDSLLFSQMEDCIYNC
jgi:hypothetical protein